MGRFSYNAGDKEPSEGFELLPDGTYDLKIVEAVLGKSSKGNPMVTVDFVVVNHMQHNGKAIKFHNVSLIPDDQKGAGIAKAFLKALGQPYKGHVDVDTDAWIGKTIKAEVYAETYNGKTYNKIKPNVKALSDGLNETEEIPF